MYFCLQVSMYHYETILFRIFLAPLLRTVSFMEPKKKRTYAFRFGDFWRGPQSYGVFGCVWSMWRCESFFLSFRNLLDHQGVKKIHFDPTHFCWDPAIWCGEKKKREKNWLSSGAFMRPQKDFSKLLFTMGFITIKQTTIWENIFGTFFQASKSRKSKYPVLDYV